MTIPALMTGLAPAAGGEHPDRPTGTAGPDCEHCDVQRDRDALIQALCARRDAAAERLAKLTPRQLQIMERVVAGELSKNIAADLGISQRTVENHRAAIMRRTGSKSLAELGQLEFVAESSDDGVARAAHDLVHQIVALSLAHRSVGECVPTARPARPAAATGRLP